MSKRVNKQGKGYGWKPEYPNKARQRRHSFRMAFESVQLPPLVDLRPKDSPIYDQGQLGSCTGNGVAGVVQFIQPSLGIPSRLFIYYNERVIEGDPNDDGGAQIHDGISTVVNTGIIPETEWPYDINQFAVQPPQNCYDDAKKDLVTQYFSLSTLEDIKQCLVAGFPVVFGMTVFESFESQSVAQNGQVPMPADSEEQVGGHCMVIVGYDDTNSWFIVRNSWGTGWGAQGYCFIPYQYIQDYASDFWTVRADTVSASNNDTSK